MTGSDGTVEVLTITNGVDLVINKTVLSHTASGGGLPSLVFGAGAGTTTPGTSSVLGTDSNFIITFTTTSGPATSSTIFTATFSTPFATTVYPTVNARSSSSSLLSGTTACYISASSTTTFTFTSGTAALGSTTSYSWTFTIVN